MIIQLQNDISLNLKSKITEAIKNINYKSTEVCTQQGNYLVCIGKADFDIRLVGALDGVKDVHRVSDSYKLVSRKWKVNPAVIDLGDEVKIGGGNLALMAGPCSIENETQVRSVVSHLVKNNIRIMRGGVYKPRSSPYAFRGLGLEGLKMFSAICKENGIKLITEVMQVSQVEEMHDYIDVFQVGARNSQNFNLLDALGKVDRPVLIKRGMSGTIDELLQSAEYIFSGGNEKLMLCERGIRTFENAYRNTFDINAIQVLKDKSHLPVIADPSHGVGIRDYVSKIALASAVAGADGIIYEVHETPEEAASDGQQTLNFEESEELVKKLRQVESIL
jgi:3-deoxy-7-phosphoheptulonate synthase